MLVSRSRGLAFSLGVMVVIAVGCGGTVTNVGSILGDGGAPDGPEGTGAEGGPAGDAAGDARDAALDAHADAPLPCAAGACGAAVCGSDECAHSCGACVGAPLHGGCFMGHCATTCAGTPCIGHDGEHICEGGRGTQSCTLGSTLGLQVCTCTGAGANAWISCGACL